jgi:two-component system response regulator FixJ
MPERLAYIVDDDAQLRDSMRVLLSTAGIACKEFDSAEAFSAQSLPLHASFLLLDLRLPGESGFALWDKLRAQPVPPVVVMITGHGDVQLAVKALRSGVFHFLEKPFDPETFLAIAREALNKAEVVRERFDRSNEIRERFAALSDREREVLALLVEGLPNKLIAYNLAISTRTAEHHRAAVMSKTGARSLSHLVRMAVDLESEDRASIDSESNSADCGTDPDAGERG